ncbi:DUF3515 domain-containing protein [Kutzneria sp. NPDC051319]|uniref:DUF3515 domain-containing protein n=1 Tax=Kutzneria sp. NPDC051319 TaxID=3155047 RepID=UPI00343F85C9
MSATPSKPVLAAAIGLPALLAVVVAAIGVIGGPAAAPPSGDQSDRTGPLALVSIDAPDAGKPACGDLIKALPQQITDAGATVPRRELAKPAPPATVAWGDAQHEPIVLRCGIGRPPELTQTAQLGGVNGVQWLDVVGDAGTVTHYVVDRSVYIALTEAKDTGTGPVQAVSAAVTATLPAQPVAPNPG